MNGWCNDMPTCHSIKLASALPSLLKRLKVVFKNTELNALQRLTISKWRHCIFYARTLTLLVIVSVPIWNWLQKLPNIKTLTEWLLLSVFAAMALLSSMTGAFLLWWHGGMDACLPCDRNGEETKAWMIMGATECIWNCVSTLRQIHTAIHTLQLENKILWRFRRFFVDTNIISSHCEYYYPFYCHLDLLAINLYPKGFQPRSHYPIAEFLHRGASLHGINKRSMPSCWLFDRHRF